MVVSILLQTTLIRPKQPALTSPFRKELIPQFCSEVYLLQGIQWTQPGVSFASVSKIHFRSEYITQVCQIRNEGRLGRRLFKRDIQEKIKRHSPALCFHVFCNPGIVASFCNHWRSQGDMLKMAK